MAGNTIGTLFRLTTFGESHGKAVGGIIDGCPPGFELDELYIQRHLDRRRPGYSDWASARKEQDAVEILSGLFEGITTGAPLGFIISNRDQRASDYDYVKDVYRPSQADFALEAKYGIRDHRGGGRLSGRETAARVAGGAVARVLLERNDIKVVAFTSRIGNVALEDPLPGHPDEEAIYGSSLRCPDASTASKMANLLEIIKKEGDSIGGVVTGVARGIPAGLGEPVFDKLHADLAKAMMSIGGAKGFEIGSGFASATMKGSLHNDLWIRDGKGFRTATNYSGGVQGGISNGMDIYFRVAFKPVPSIRKEQQSMNAKGEYVNIEGRGRHDVCIVPRAVPVVEAMTCIIIADHLLRQLSNSIKK